MTFLGRIGMLVGVVLAGVLGELIGLRGTLLVAALGGIASTAWIVFSRILALREAPILAEEEPLAPVGL